MKQASKRKENVVRAFFHTVKRIISLFLVFITVIPVLFLTVNATENEPSILYSKGAMLYCLESDTVLFEKESNTRFAPGVLIKLMVAVTALDELENRGLTVDSYFTASKSAIRDTKGKHISMVAGEKFRISELIAVMLHADADDAAHVIAEEMADTYAAFVALMNEKAKDLGMENTEYFSVTGTFDTKSYTTAADQMKLASYAIKLHQIAETVYQIRAVIPQTNKSQARYYGTTNYLRTTRVNADYYLASSTGLICGTQGDAGYCGILSSRKDGLNYIAVVLGAENSRVLVSEEHTEKDENGNDVVVPAEYKTIYNGLSEARALLVYGESRFSYIKAVSTATPIVNIPVKLGAGIDKIAVMPEFDLEIFVPDYTDKEKEVSYTYVLDKKFLTAPVKAGQRVGTLYVSYKGELMGEVPLVTRNNVERDGLQLLFFRVKELLSTPFIIVLIILTVFAALFYILSTAITRQKKVDERKRDAEKSRRYLSSGKDKK